MQPIISNSAEASFSASVDSSQSNTGIAIIGIGCRYPGGVESPSDLWSLLADGKSTITEIPLSRWNLDLHFHEDCTHPLTQHVRHGGFVNDIEKFDPAFFGISPREAVCMDPQQRLLLEVTWRAIEDSGYKAELLKSREVGVFIGISSSDYSSLLWTSNEDYGTPDNEPYILPGNTGCIAANRISYFLDLKGPSFTIDTACSSSLVAVHLACESLAKGESSMAFVGGVQALLHPGVQTMFCKAGLLSPEGRCKSFDAQANGYVRSEGAGIVLLKPLANALADGDQIYAVIHGSAVNSDGRSNGMAAPNLRAQIDCVRKAFKSSGIVPGRTQYVEAHGTGTRQGDPIELRALGTVLSEGRPEHQPCRVGSVKSNLGHSETAAGVTGLIKAALCIRHRQLPPSVNFETPNPAIDFEGLKLQVQTDLSPFPCPEQPLVVGVSSFGFGGTNAHVVLSDVPQLTSRASRYGPQAPVQLLAFSARTPKALSNLAQAYLELLNQQPASALHDLAATTHLTRSAFRERAVCIASDRDELMRQLELISQGRQPSPAGVQQGIATSRHGKVAWMFTGQGSQSPGMAGELLNGHPSFQAAFARVSALLDPHLEVPLVSLMAPAAEAEEAAAETMASTGYTQPALFAMGYALSQLWLEWGVEPDLLLGHSIGEVLAAHLAGVFSLEDACRLVIARARLMQELPSNGSMAAILCSPERLEPWLSEEPAVTIAAFNGPTNTVVSGPLKGLAQVMDRAEAAGLEVRKLRVSHAFHSPAMKPMLAAFEQELRQIKFSAPHKVLISNLTGEVVGAEIAQPDYWCEHVINPVRFQQGVNTAVTKGVQVFLEIGARPTLIGMARVLLQDNSISYLPSLVPGQSAWKSMYNSFGRFFLAGYPVNWQGFHLPFEHRRVAVPGYIFDKQTFWWSRRGESSAITMWGDHVGIAANKRAVSPASSHSPVAGPIPQTPTEHQTLQLIDLPTRERHYWRRLSPTEPSDLRDHRIRGTVVFPAAGFLDHALNVLQQEQRPLQLCQLTLEKPLRLGDAAVSLVIEFRRENDNDQESAHHAQPASLRFLSRSDADDSTWVTHGRVELPGDTEMEVSPPFPLNQAPKELAAVNLEGFYADLEQFGLCYGPTYRTLRRLVHHEDRAWAELQRPEGASDRGLLDSCFQAVAALLDPTASAGQLFLPVGLGSLSINMLPLPDRFSCQVKLRPNTEPAFVICDLVLHADQSLIGWIKGLKLRRLPRQSLEWLFPVAAESEPTKNSALSWLIHQGWSDPVVGDAGSPAQEPVLLEPPVLLGRPSDQAGSLAEWCAAQGQTLLSSELHEPLPAGSGAVLIWPRLGEIASAAEIENLCGQLLRRVQQLATGPARPVWLLLEGDGLAQGAIEGLIKTASLELPQLGWTLLRLPPTIAEHPSPKDWWGIWRVAEHEVQLRWHGGGLQSCRLEALAAGDRLRLGTSAFGSLDDLEWQPLPRLGLARGEVEVAVEATGLNFRDVLNALGLLAAYSAQLGMDAAAKVPFGGECVGRIVAVGEGVDPSRVGERVLAALAVGSLATHVLCRAELCLPLPEHLSVELGAGISTVFLTAVYGLESLAALQPGEVVLIHAAAGGVGQAAVQVARARGARILATASQGKQSALLEQGVEAVFDSRQLDFAEQVLHHTGGRGADVVLNSLKGDWVNASFRALAPGGRFVELGKIEIWSAEQARDRRPDARYLPFDLLEVAAADPTLVRQLLMAVLHDLQLGRYQPIPLQIFPVAQTVDAFRLMASARHMGKVVIRYPDRSAPLQIHSQATYLVTGALGGIGLQLLEWLVARGATSLIGIGRSAGNPGPAAALVLDRLRGAGVDCRLLEIDLGASDDAGLAAQQQLADTLAGLPPEKPLAGVFHAAGTLDDGLIGSQTEERFQRVMAAKLRGWQLLHQVVRPGPFFVAFSSMASVLGSPGQVAYSAANGALDDDCRSRSHDSNRSAEGVHLSLQWGPWAGAGMAGALDERDRKRLRLLGIGLLEPAQAFEALELALQRGESGTLAVLNNNWQQIAAQSDPRQAALLSLLSKTDASAEQAAAPLARQALLGRLDLSPESQHQAIAVAVLQEKLASVMGLDDPSTLDPGESLFRIGLDSLMAVEMAATINRDLGVKLELESLVSEPTLEGLASFVLSELRTPQLSKRPSGPDLARVAELGNDWCINGSFQSGDCPGDEILLTGASGFLGAYLLAGQLKRWPDLRVRCLVRARDADQGLEKICRNLNQYGLWKRGWKERIMAIPGDLSQPDFGLEASEFLNLGKGIGGILHNGAQPSQMATYSQLAVVNVEGTRQMLTIAARNGGIPFQMISSVAALEAKEYRDKELYETDDISAWEGIYNGYSQSKWASERLVINAGNQGLPMTVYRPPLIGGHSRTGSWHKDDLIYRLFKGCLSLKMVIDLPWEIDIVPVDYVANAVTALGWSPESFGKCFHLQHPHPILLGELMDKFSFANILLKTVPMEKWIEAIDSNPSNPLQPLKPLFIQRWGEEQLTYPELNQIGFRARPNCDATVRLLAERGVVCPEFQSLLVPYARSLITDAILTG
jgi:thioester reductase-like protein